MMVRLYQTLGVITQNVLGVLLDQSICQTALLELPSVGRLLQSI